MNPMVMSPRLYSPLLLSFPNIKEASASTGETDDAFVVVRGATASVGEIDNDSLNLISSFDSNFSFSDTKGFAE